MINRISRSFTKTAFPYTEESITALKGRIIYYEASRGCMFNCSYCLSAAESHPYCPDCPDCPSNDSSLHEHNPEYRTIEQITAEICLLSRFEGTVKFVDRTFNANHKVSRHIWHLMVENPPAGCFHFEIHPMLLQNEDLDLIGQLKPGTAQFEIGIQSTDPAILKNVNRADNWVVSQKAIARLIKPGKFHIHLDQIVACPEIPPLRLHAALMQLCHCSRTCFSWAS